MDYKEKYEMALERAKCLYSQHEVEWRDEDIEYIFPELKKSEDERIRKELITHCRNTRCVTEEGAERIAKWLAWLKKQGEKPADKKEPKIKVGDWVIFAENHNSIYQVERIDNYRYYLRHYLGGTLSLHFDNDELIRLWTLQDAKDGDILVSNDDGRPFIFKGCLDPNHPNCPVAYCGIDTEDLFLIGNNCWWDDGKCHPATKEQRDLLFQKMHEAGYMWDSESKQLLSLEAKPSVEKKNAWSEEDENILKNLTDYFMVDDCLQFKEEKIVKWLQSLKQRCAWKPSDEQIEALESATENCAYSEYQDCLKELIVQLKKL